MASTAERLRKLAEAQSQRRESLAKLAARNRESAPSTVVVPEPSAIHRKPPPVAPKDPPAAPTSVAARVQNALVPLFKDDGIIASSPSGALVALADLYLHAAKHRSRHIALVWPASLTTLTVIHALATLARWREGDKQGVRGLLFPVKANAFHRLNHIHFERSAILDIAQKLVEVNTNGQVRRPMPEKDAFWYSLTDSSLSTDSGERFNPTIGELVPHFLAAPEFKGWETCEARLLALIRAKLARRAHSKALRMNCAVIGNPATAPDALFALDGRMSESELRQACQALAKRGPPEVVLVQATRAIRFQAPGWKGRIARFCLMLEEVFRDAVPGVIVVTDEPHAAYRLKDELWQQNDKRDAARRWHTPHEFRISGFPSTVDADGLLPAGEYEALHPAPREFDVHIVDADAAKLSNRLVRVANSAPGGREAAKPLVAAASFLSRLAALPCGVRHMSEYLAGPDVSDQTRRAFDWLTYLGAVQDFDRRVSLGENRQPLLQCLDHGSRLFSNYNAATPFAHKLAALVAHAAAGKKRGVAIVFTTALYRRLAERFLSGYDQYPGGVRYDDFPDRVHLLSATHLAEHLDNLQGATLVFAGLNEDCLRLLLTDDRVPAHSVLLLTQRAGQFLRGTLKPIVENFPEFRAYKPRMESVLRQLKDLPDDASVLSTSDYVLPTFRVELATDVSSNGYEIDPDAWAIRLDTGLTQYRRDTSEVYAYDPASKDASDAGFRVCQVRTLEIGDKVFVMSAELRELVEQVLRDAGVNIQSDKTFETALRSYHEQVRKRLAQHFPHQATATDQVVTLRREMLKLNPRLEGKLPTLQAMRYWIALQHSQDTPFEQLKPQAPLHEDVFKAFAQVLGMSALEAAYQWQRVIMAVRNSRRLDGRHVSDIYAYMLLQPESAMANSNISRHTLNQLFDKARDCVVAVEFVGPYKETQQ